MIIYICLGNTIYVLYYELINIDIKFCLLFITRSTRNVCLRELKYTHLSSPTTHSTLLSFLSRMGQYFPARLKPPRPSTTQTRSATFWLMINKIMEIPDYNIKYNVTTWRGIPVHMTKWFFQMNFKILSVFILIQRIIIL